MPYIADLALRVMDAVLLVVVGVRPDAEIYTSVIYMESLSS